MRANVRVVRHVLVRPGAVMLSLALAAGTANAQVRQEGHAFLVQRVGLTPAELATVARGGVVTRELETKDGRDVAVLGAVQVDVPRAQFVERLSDFRRELQTPTRLRGGLFSNPPAAADVAAMDVEQKSLEEMRTCKPNECNFKLPATDMQHFRAAVDWSAPDAHARAVDYVRQRMVEYVTDYERRGNVAMAVYDDMGGVHASDALATMLADSSFMLGALPTLSRYLAQYPRDTLPGAANVVFWSIDVLPHVRSVLRIMHETVFTPPEVPGTTIFASKQLYASHYFEAGLELLAAVDGSAADDAAQGSTILVALRRYRFDHIPRLGMINLRGRVVGGLRDNMVSDLGRMKKEAEAAGTGRR